VLFVNETSSIATVQLSFGHPAAFALEGGVGSLVVTLKASTPFLDLVARNVLRAAHYRCRLLATGPMLACPRVHATGGRRTRAAVKSAAVAGVAR
jgi:hypothetical protein